MFAFATLLLCSATPAFQFTQAELDSYLQKQSGPFQERLHQVAQDWLGTPYASGPLGEGPQGSFDKDPLMDHTKVDCVTFCEQTIAMAASKSYQDAFDRLQRIRYRNGEIGYEQRNHFMITDWIANNPWCKDISGTLGVKTAPLTRTISRRDFFQRVKAEGLGKDTPDRVQTIQYVPAADAGRAEPKLPKAALIVFIGKKPEWLFAVHTGLYLRGADGQGQLYHASSTAVKVVAAPFAHYVESQQDRFWGFTAYEIGEPK